MTTSRRLTIFEGADGSGKTTAARAFTDRTQAAYVHFGAFPRAKDIAHFYVEGMLPALLGYQDVVFDRSWFDEKPYGEAFRHGADRIGPVVRRKLMRLAMRCGALVVVCSPPWETCRQNYLSRKHVEYLENEDQLRVVYDYFAQGGGTDLYPLTYTYDYRQTPGPLDPENLDRCRYRAHPLSLQSAGNWSAPWVLVGERFTDVCSRDTLYQWPFSSFTGSSCGWWLTEQLEEAGVHEKELLWVNSDQDLRQIPSVPGRQFIALGREAEVQLQRHGKSCLEVDHPQSHKRFNYRKTYPLLDLLTSRS